MAQSFPSAHGAENPPRKTILVLEDLEEVRELVTHFLMANGFDVRTAQNGLEGLERLQGESFDAILSDMVMPGYSGEEFYRAVEETRPELCRRFVFMTGFRDNQQIDEFIGRINGVLLYKPFKASELVDVVSAVVDRARMG